MARRERGDAPAALLPEVDALADALPRYAPRLAALAELRLAVGDAGARQAWREAWTHAGSEPERRAYGRRLEALEC